MRTADRQHRDSVHTAQHLEGVAQTECSLHKQRAANVVVRPRGRLRLRAVIKHAVQVDLAQALTCLGAQGDKTVDGDCSAR